MRFSHIIAATTTAAVLGTAGISIAGAATSGTTTPPPTTAAKGADGARADHAHPRYRLRRLIREAIGLSAKTIGIPRADLVTQLRAGKTIGETASAHGVLPKTVIDAIVKAGQAKLDAAKAAGKISDERYARLEERLPKIADRFVTKWHLRPAAG